MAEIKLIIEKIYFYLTNKIAVILLTDYSYSTLYFHCFSQTNGLVTTFYFFIFLFVYLEFKSHL